MKHSVPWILVCALLLPLMAGCSSGPADPGEASQTQTAVPSTPDASQTASEEEVRDYPYYAGHDFGGKNFHFLNAPRAYWDMFTSVTADEMNGEVINDAVFERNSRISEKLNCSLSEEGFAISSGEAAE